MNISVGLMEGRPAVEAELTGTFEDSTGKSYGPGRHRFTSDIILKPAEFSSSSFALDDVTIGIGFHWERKERQVFRGSLRILRRGGGLTVINDVPLEEYVNSVISSEMSASCPLELLKAHAVISRSWLKANATIVLPPPPTEHEIIRWYGREAHADFEVCADDHCQRYQGITKAFSEAASQATRATAGEFLVYNGSICDARFSKSCGGITEVYSVAWDDRDVPYLQSVHDAAHPSARPYCDRRARTQDHELLARILPGFDQETVDFYRWQVEYSPQELGELVKARLGMDLGPVAGLEPLDRGASGRIFRLKVVGERDYVIIGKELEIRRALSRSHLYSSAFTVDRDGGRFVLRGSGWGHGVGLCQIGAAVMANEGKRYEEILSHYYRGAELTTKTQRHKEV
jgi:stage II sporulation protein D